MYIRITPHSKIAAKLFTLKPLTAFFLLVIGVLCIINCGDTPSTENQDNIITITENPVIAIVNGEKIKLEDLNKRFLPVKLQYTLSLPPEVDKNMQQLQQEFLQKLIDKKLLLQEVQNKKITVDRNELEQYLNKISDPSADKKSNNQQNKNGNDNKNWQKEIKQELLINKLIKQEIEQNILVTEEEAASYYDMYPEQFKQPEQVRVRQILMETEWEAEALRKKLIRGADFKKLAEANSLSPDGAKGGDLGYFGSGYMPPEFDEVAFSLKKGKISKVFKSSYGYHIFKLIDKKKAGKLSFDQVKDKIKQKIMAGKKDKAITNWMAQLRSRANIKIVPYFATGKNKKPATG